MSMSDIERALARFKAHWSETFTDLPAPDTEEAVKVWYSVNSNK